MATTLHLVRHAAHGLLGRTLTGRMPGVDLGAEGRAQAGCLAATLATRPIRAVCSSPLERAQQTALPIAAAHGLAVVTDPGLNEVDFGTWTGLSFDTLAADPAWHPWNALRSLAPTPGGESMAEAQGRAVAAILRIRAAWPDAEVAVVSHQDILRAILTHCLGAPLDLLQRIDWAPAHRTVVTLHGADIRVGGVNLPPGLPAG